MKALTAEERRRLAVELMGWKVIDHYYKEPARPIMVQNWQPESRLAQAFMVAGKMPAWAMHYNCDDTKKYCFTLMDGTPEGIIDEFADTPALAICLAALKWLERKREAA